MDGHARIKPSNQGQASPAAGHSLVAAASADTATARWINEAPGIAWLSARPEYWPPLPCSGEAPRGVACLLFGVGEGGVGWVDRLARSDWFAGLEPRAEDLASAGGVARGAWVMPANGASEHRHDVNAAAKAFLASALMPSAWYATVAVARGAGPAEQSAALGLVSALMERRDPLGRRMTVVVTVEAAPGSARDAAFVRRVLDCGAFLVRGGTDPGAADGDHLHHFPLRATVMPRQGRLVCVDLADYLHTWRPGRVADLHVLSSDLDAAEQALRTLPMPGRRSDGVRALNLGFQPTPGQNLSEIDRFASRCCELLLVPDGDAVFTDTDRLDGRTSSVDLLIIYAAMNGG